MAHRSLVLLSFLGLLAGVVAPPAAAQTGRDIAALVAKAQSGGIEEVRALLPAMRTSHKDKAGVLFLNALTEPNAEKAVELYQRIADEHPESEWADDALYRLYQYSYAVGAYRTARSYTERIAKEHPKSPFLTREQRAAAQADAPSKSKATTAAPVERPAEKVAGTPSASGQEAESYAVQVGAFSKVADARKQADELKEKGYTAYLREKTVKGRTVHAVWLGVFPAFSQAQAFARKMKEQQNIDAIVVRR